MCRRDHAILSSSLVVGFVLVSLSQNGKCGRIQSSANTNIKMLTGSDLRSEIDGVEYICIF